jgi:dihydrolipoamide dehydrogenase
MSAVSEVRVPDIGGIDSVEVIEVLVAPGDRIEVEQSLITLESEKSTMEVPSPVAGMVRELAVTVGSTVSEGSLILKLDVEEKVEDVAAGGSQELGSERDQDAVEITKTTDVPQNMASTPPQPSAPASDAGSVASPPAADLSTEVLVIGAGPGGYTAAFRAADLGKRVVLIERYPTLGGVCLNVGCIPSKALLHLAYTVTEAKRLSAHGISFGEPSYDLGRIRDFKAGIVAKLTRGLAGLAERRKVEVVHGTGTFAGPNLMRVVSAGGDKTIAFEHAIIAAGSEPVELPMLPNDDERVMDSTGALELADIPERMLVIGGGIIGLEMASVYSALGTKITVVEVLDHLIDGADRDLVKPLEKIIRERYENIFIGSRVTGAQAVADGIQVSFEGGDAPATDTFDRVMVAVGRRPSGNNLGADNAGVTVDEHGFIAADLQQRTNAHHIFAIGDITGNPMLAHKATHQGKVAAEAIAGHKTVFEPATIPSVAYTDPEVAWMGLTETEAKKQGVPIEKVSFPWQASGRALGIDRPEGITKLILDPDSRRILGAGIVGVNAGDLISELVLALEMGADAEDIALSIHPHPTLSESVAMAAEMAERTITDLYLPPKKTKRT